MMSEKTPGVNLEVRLKCAKGTKMSKHVKTLGALLPFASHADRKQYRKLLAKTQHEADAQSKTNRRGSSVPGESRALRPGEASTADIV